MTEDVFRAVVIAALALSHGVALVALFWVRSQGSALRALGARVDARTPPLRAPPVKVRGFVFERLPERVPLEEIDAGDGPPPGVAIHYPSVTDDGPPRC